ncbi:NAD(P)-dependent oxidoreductase [Alkalicoccus luteus]|uniref:NAD(P)H-binding protein n=1 Tax=Alkalicoccus luteus TaxID=1237094 RepID=A0A969TSI9_9BACI|nr:NAD(P)H-binding protein [Alkalicoccus luteus]NJP36623.1 NAD(P)H-binding protein [Alkalicoccus luteus]
MHITILGATGRTGSEFTSRAIDAGWTMNLLVRTPEKVPDYWKNNSSVTIIEGNAVSKADVARAIDDKTEAVFSALSTDKADVLSQSTPIITDRMQKLGINRFVSIGTAGILNALHSPDKFRYETDESKKPMTRSSLEHASVYHHLKNTNLTWTIFCPTYLPDGTEESPVAWKIDFMPDAGKRITPASAAAFVFKHFTDPQFYQCRVGMAEDTP